MGWLIGIGVLQLIVLVYIAYQLEQLPKGEWLREALQMMLNDARRRDNSN